MICLALAFSVALAAAPVANIPFNGGAQGRIMVEAKIDDQGPFPFFFDTGSVNILSLNVAKQLGLNITGKQTLTAFGGVVETASTIVESVKLGSLNMGETPIVVIGGGPFTKGGPAGMLGWEFLSKLVAEIDYQHGSLKFYDSKTYHYSGHGVRLPLTVHGLDLLTIPGEVFGANASLQLDSGAESPLTLFPRFVKTHHLHSSLNAITGYGFGGLTRAMVLRAPGLTIGGFDIKSPLVHLSVDEAGIESTDIDGNIGAPLLRQFTCIYDVPHNSFYLEPNEWFNKAQLTDRSGLVLDTRGASAKVLFVYPNSPAARAGINAGDELTDASGHPLSDSQWHDLLDSASGTVVRMTVTSNTNPRPIHFTLRDYL